MTSDSPGSQSSNSSHNRHGWTPLAITATLSIVLIVVLVCQRGNQPSEESDSTAKQKGSPSVRLRPLPLPPEVVAIEDLENVAHPVQLARPTLHTFVLEQRDGTQVLRIRAHADGDEMIVDVATGRLLAVRDAKGKTTLWPMSPMNAIESPQKSS